MTDASMLRHAAYIRRFVENPQAYAAARPHALDSAIIGSWRRCAIDYALDPVQEYAPSILDPGTLKELRERHSELVQIASAEIDWLYDYISESGYALVLTDAHGVVLYEKTDRTLDRAFHTAGLRLGADWSERREGTNGIGTCIAEDRPVIVHRNDHFRSRHIGLTCFGAPIHDPSGRLVAVLDASTLNAHEHRGSLAHTMTLVNLSARLIEKCLFLQHFRDAAIFRFHARPEFVNLQHDGALALAQDATVMAADETAVRLLGVKGRSELIGRSIDELFEVQPHELLDPPPGARCAMRPVRDAQLGRKFFASIERGAGRTPGAPHSAPISAPVSPPTPRLLHVAPAAHRPTQLTLEQLAGDDPQMQRIVRCARRVAVSNVSVMIQGATGTGKEVFARALHAASGRANQPFVALNCAAIPESLIESELFGYRSGAFTGARREGMRGKILQSSGGTLFLDEIGDMPLPLQTRLLRVLEEHEVLPLGAETPIKVDLRVICASHQNLRAMIGRNQFREDLYYRLNGITLELPRLADRTDKERLIREFLAAETTDGRPAAIETDAFQQLLAYSWPGNIRELRNVIRTALAICDGGVVRLRDLPSEVRCGGSGAAARNRDPDERADNPGDADAQREALMRAIRECDGNFSRAAQQLGVSRNTLYRRCKRLGVPIGAARAAD